ncbi:hypothetical protein RUM43_013617 [Polyplax serrata]|uniref:Uncharacterized protein n=1 Tax=Polyplax serrata TaxID=468196 RepID=A0AAN8S723_POLSC
MEDDGEDGGGGQKKKREEVGVVGGVGAEEKKPAEFRVNVRWRARRETDDDDDAMAGGWWLMKTCRRGALKQDNREEPQSLPVLDSTGRKINRRNGSCG